MDEAVVEAVRDDVEEEWDVVPDEEDVPDVEV